MLTSLHQCCATHMVTEYSTSLHACQHCSSIYVLLQKAIPNRYIQSLQGYLGCKAKLRCQWALITGYNQQQQSFRLICADTGKLLHVKHILLMLILYHSNRVNVASQPPKTSWFPDIGTVQAFVETSGMARSHHLVCDKWGTHSYRDGWRETLPRSHLQKAVESNARILAFL